MPFYTADLVSSMVHLPSLTCPSGCLCHRNHACHRIGTGPKDVDGAIMELELLHQQAVADEEECAKSTSVWRGSRRTIAKPGSTAFAFAVCGEMLPYAACAVC